MNRRTALTAIFAIAGQILEDDARLKAQGTISTGTLATFTQPEELTVALGGVDGYKRFSFTYAGDKITITAEELFEALKA